MAFHITGEILNTEIGYRNTVMVCPALLFDARHSSGAGVF
jgi:hypothetical protein